MKSLPEEGIDERFEQLTALLRSARPGPSDELRERVRLVAAAQPAPAPPRRGAFPTRRALLALAPVAALAIALGALTLSGGDADRQAGEPERREAAPESLRSAPADTRAGTTATAEAAGATAPFAQDAQRAARARAPLAPGSLPPTARRLQDYRAELRVRVARPAQLSSATSRAMRITRSLGGYIVSASYARGKEGDSSLVVRVPVDKVQTAILRFSQLGTLLAQRIEIQDLQGGVNRQSERIGELRGLVAELERALADPELTDEARRQVLEARLAQTRRQLDARLEARSATIKRGRFSRVSLTLTTRDDAQAPPAPSPPGRFEDTLRDAVSVLGTIVGWLLYGLIVASPFLALALAAALLDRRRRRRGELGLLERA